MDLKRYIFSKKADVNALLRLPEASSKKWPLKKIVYSQEKDTDCDPSDAEMAAGALVRNANNAMQMSTDDKDGDDKSFSIKKKEKKPKKANVAESALLLPVYIFEDAKTRSP